jgi:UDP-N-acetyl-D-galactosamine dehydrogenase
MSNKKSIAIIGLGYVGLPLAIEFSKKRNVIGFDINEGRVNELIDGYDATNEVLPDELRLSSSLRFTSDSENLILASIYIVTVPTPVDSSKRPDFGHLESACEIIGRVLKPRDIVVFESTVYPGATEEICVPILARVSGLQYLNGLDEELNGVTGFYVGYSPERINPGDKERKLANIVKITSGSTPNVANEIDELYKEIINAGTFPVGSIMVAEAAKVIENSQRDLNIAFVNELSIIFTKLGIDTAEVLAAAETKWNFLPFKPGLVGGHCIGVDPYYLTHKAEEIGYISQVILSGRRINDGMSEYLATQIAKMMSSNGIELRDSSVGIMGLTFKENCPDVRNSKVLDLIKSLKEWGIRVKVTDSRVKSDLVFKEHGIILSNLEELIELDSLIVAVAHDEYKNLTPLVLRKMCRRKRIPVLADIKAIWSKRDAELAGFTVFRL